MRGGELRGVWAVGSVRSAARPRRQLVCRGPALRRRSGAARPVAQLGDPRPAACARGGRVRAAGCAGRRWDLPPRQFRCLPKLASSLWTDNWRCPRCGLVSVAARAEVREPVLGSFWWVFELRSRYLGSVCAGFSVRAFRPLATCLSNGYRR